MAFIEQPPLLYRILFPEAVWRIKVKRSRTAYLTFDDGPTPELTEWLLDTLDRYGVKATFFCVGANVERHPELFAEIKRRGHSVGNHTMNHCQGMKCRLHTYLRDVRQADLLIDSILFRPPHGLLKRKQSRAIRHHYNLIMYDVVTRDYARKITPEEVFRNVKRYTRNGSIIVFHDSLKAEHNVRYALPRAIEWLQTQGYELRAIPQ